MKKLRWIVLMVLVSLSILPVLAQQVTIRTNANLNLRTVPSVSNSSVLVRIPLNTDLTPVAISEDRNWVVVSYNEKTGWISLGYVTVVGGTLRDLPVSAQSYGATLSPLPSGSSPQAEATPVNNVVSGLESGGIFFIDQNLNMHPWQSEVPLDQRASSLATARYVFKVAPFMNIQTNEIAYRTMATCRYTATQGGSEVIYSVVHVGPAYRVSMVYKDGGELGGVFYIATASQSCAATMPYRRGSTEKRHETLPSLSNAWGWVLSAIQYHGHRMP